MNTLVFETYGRSRLSGMRIGTWVPGKRSCGDGWFECSRVYWTTTKFLSTNTNLQRGRPPQAQKNQSESRCCSYSGFTCTHKTVEVGFSGAHSLTCPNCALISSGRSCTSS